MLRKLKMEFKGRVVSIVRRKEDKNEWRKSKNEK